MTDTALPPRPWPPMNPPGPVEALLTALDEAENRNRTMLELVRAALTEGEEARRMLHVTKEHAKKLRARLDELTAQLAAKQGEVERTVALDAMCRRLVVELHERAPEWDVTPHGERLLEEARELLSTPGAR